MMMKDIIDFVIADDRRLLEEERLKIEKEQKKLLEKLEFYQRPEESHVVLKLNLKKIYNNEEVYHASKNFQPLNVTIPPQKIAYTISWKEGEWMDIVVGDGFQLTSYSFSWLRITTKAVIDDVMQIYISGKSIPSV